MKYIGLLLSAVALFCCQAGIAQEQELTPEEAQYLAEMTKLWNSLEPKQGEVVLPNGVATLNVPEDFYYLSPKDATTVLVDVWGNPPETAADTQGMLFPSGMTPFDGEAWGVTIDYEADGFVSDADADEVDYDDLLAQMKDDTRAASDARIEQGYGSMELVGWAARPFYDRASHKLHWAKELKFGDQAVNTLNYNIRVLGRKGVLLLNFISGMDQKATIDAKLESVLALAEFNDGYRYDEFNPDLDQVAAYGIGALVAGKLAAKTGLLAAALIFVKKFGILLLVGLGAVVSKLFKRKAAA
jgi:uncharacterized membrane-anchored protein